MSEAGEIVGMVDVLKLTYATLDQINSMSNGEGEGPAWNKFWLSLDNESESVVSGDGSRAPRTIDARSLMSPDMQRADVDRGDSVMPGESASHHDDESPERSAVAGANMTPPEEAPFAFKFKAPSGRMHRLQVTASAGMEDLISNVTAKLGSEVTAVGGEPSFENGRLGKSGFALSYLDNEGDTVSITTNQDLMEAISLAQLSKRDKVDLFVHNPEMAPLPATLNPHPGTHPEPAFKERIRKHLDEENGDETGKKLQKQYDDEHEVESGEKTNKGSRSKQGKKEEQVIAGVPNEVLLPGALAALAVVIIGVFFVSRSSSR